MKKINEGQKVTYHSHGKHEQGIVKSISDDEHVFVVYHCDGNWDDYKNYTAVRTKISDLTLGWDEPEFDMEMFTCKCRDRYSIEEHGHDNGYALYFGRCDHKHGYNLCHLSDFDYKGKETREKIVEALNKTLET